MGEMKLERCSICKCAILNDEKYHMESLKIICENVHVEHKIFICEMCYSIIQLAEEEREDENEHWRD